MATCSSEKLYCGYWRKSVGYYILVTTVVLVVSTQRTGGDLLPGKYLAKKSTFWGHYRAIGGGFVGGRSPERQRTAQAARFRRQEPEISTADNNASVSTVTLAVPTPTLTVVEDTDNTTNTNSSISTTKRPPGKDSGQGAGVIVGAIFGVLLGGAILGGALYLLIRYKRAQAAEYNRSVQVHMSSTRNAGVYVDLVEPSEPGRPPTSYTSLKQQNNTQGDKRQRLMHEDLYEYDSDDEVCVYN